MKKTVVTILLVLPFILIYFISFAGRILSTYTHIYVERIAVVDSRGNEYDDDSYIKIDKGEEFNLNIKIFPELASNKEVKINNSNTAVCSIDENNNVLGLNYGVCKIIITSVDRHYVQYKINIEVTHDDIRDIIVNKSELTLTKGKAEQLDITIEPSTTTLENRGLVWESDDPSVAIVNNGLVVAVSEGQTIIRVKSDHKDDVYKEITVNVITSYGTGIFFKHDLDSVYEVNSSEFDLKTITLVNVLGYTISDVWYEIDTIYDTSKVDTTNFGDGIIKFNEQKYILSISMHLDTGESEYTDSIRIWYIQK